MNEKGHFSFGFLMRRLTNWELTSSYAWEKSHPCSQVLTGNIQDVLTDDSANAAYASPVELEAQKK
ncbi:MAG: hypothetical protein EOS76_19615 [Mesorhizobium sp.]|uniref:hypothetical protein n=1 Tax=Mesorhizobium sp. TaxID=1871066 RepID=UPI000FE4B656|nr:hypothetical protein [Mesorhizobium sp.]RWE16960.1 MAG: hypothetical protein EOS76_19615 [Mesorhizobium sp.]